MTTTYVLRLELVYDHEEEQAPDPRMLCQIIASALGPIQPGPGAHLRAIHARPIKPRDEATS